MADLSASGARSAYTRSVTNHAAIRTPATSFYVSKHLKPTAPIEASPIDVGGGVWADRPGGRRHCGGRGVYVIGSGNAEFTLATGFAANGFGEHSPGGYSLLSLRSSPKFCRWGSRRADRQ